MFAAEGFAKATRRLGVAALTAGPGVTNGISAIASAQANCSPVCVLGGRAPELRWGSGSLQEIDHLPFVSPLVKSAETVKDAGAIGGAHCGGARPLAERALRADLRRLPAGRGLQRGRGGDPGGGGAGRAAGGRGARRPRRCWPGPSARRSWPAPASTGVTARMSCGRWPRRSASRSSSTGSAAAACPPITSWPSAVRAAPGCRAPTWRWWSACRSTSGSASAAASARRRS